MSQLIAKLETDPALRVRAGKIVSGVMVVVSCAAVIMVGYISWGM
ncbi:hypothetical protein [Duganella sp. Leaf126]|nr:hypothetical protein [Duganella sp. Leaf126]